MITEQSKKTEEINKKAAEAAKELKPNIQKEMDSIRAAIEVASLTDLEVGSLNEAGEMQFKARIPEGKPGQYLTFQYKLGSPVLLVKGTDAQLPSIPVQSEKLSDMIADAAVSYFKSRLVVEEAVPATEPASAPKAKEGAAASAPKAREETAAITN
jgi:hypothetical protein